MTDTIPNVPMRYLLVTARRGDTAETVAAYLPDNYRVIGQFYEVDTKFSAVADGGVEVDHDTARLVVVVGGRDHYGWTLDAYVRPRLLSGLIGSEEIDLSHPVMREIPA